MEKKQVFKRVTEVEGISVGELEMRKTCLCPICGKQDGVAVTLHYIFAYCDEHKIFWIDNYRTKLQEGTDETTDPRVVMASYDFIDDRGREILRERGIESWEEAVYRPGWPRNRSDELIAEMIFAPTEDEIKAGTENSEAQLATEQQHVIGQYDGPDNEAYCPICGFADVSGSIVHETLLGCTKHNLFWTYMYENNMWDTPKIEVLAAAKGFSTMSYVDYGEDGTRVMYPPQHPLIIQKLFRDLEDLSPTTK
jgi:hypothetical protein